MAWREGPEDARHHPPDAAPAIGPGAEPGREHPGLPLRQPPRHLPVRNLPGHRGTMLRRLERLRQRPCHPAPDCRAGLRQSGQRLRPLVSDVTLLPARIFGAGQAIGTAAPDGLAAMRRRDGPYRRPSPLVGRGTPRGMTLPMPSPIAVPFPPSFGIRGRLCDDPARSDRCKTADCPNLVPCARGGSLHYCDMRVTGDASPDRP